MISSFEKFITYFPHINPPWGRTNMNRKGDSSIIWMIIAILVILGIMYLLNTHAENVRENPNATDPELIGETVYETGEDVAVVGESWLSRLWDSISNQNMPPSTINSTANQNETT